MPDPTPYDVIPPNPITPSVPPGEFSSVIPVFPPAPGPPPPGVPFPTVVQRYFSPSTLGFYSDEPVAAPRPPDAVPITGALWQQMMAENSAGKNIVFDVATQLPKAVAVQVGFANIFAGFTTRLRATDWTQLGDTPPAIQASFKTYRDALRLLMQNLPPDLNNVVWPAVPPIADPLFNRAMTE